MKQIVFFAAIIFFVACDNGKENLQKGLDNGKEKLQQVVKGIGEGKDKVESKLYETALQKAVNELNKEFPQSFDYGVKVENMDLDDKYVNVNVFVEENAIVTVPLIGDKLKENRAEVISKINSLLDSNDNKDFIKELGIPGDFANIKSMLTHILKKTNREIAICARGSINTDKVIVTTISPDELK